jgi:hypothetical protein
MLDPETLREIAGLVAPHVVGEGARTTFLVTAFGANHPLINQIDISGPPFSFAVNLVTRLNNYGSVKPDKPALVALLETLKFYVGTDQAPRIDELIEQVGGKNTSSPGSPEPTKTKGQICILFMAASPVDEKRLRLDEEIRLIDERLRLAELGSKFKLQQAHAVRVSDIQDHLLRYKPQIVHFSGHGDEDGELIFQDAAGMSKPVTPQALGDLFRILKGRVCCVVLNACNTALQADAIAAEVDCVIGMSMAIGDRAALEFSGSFYRALGYGETVGTAFELGRNAVSLVGIGRDDLPVMNLRKGADPQKICVV